MERINIPPERQAGKGSKGELGLTLPDGSFGVANGDISRQINVLKYLINRDTGRHSRDGGDNQHDKREQDVERNSH